MGLFDRFSKPKWQHEDHFVRREAVEKLDDEEILIQIAKNDDEWTVRSDAVEKITD